MTLTVVTAGKIKQFLKKKLNSLANLEYPTLTDNYKDSRLQNTLCVMVLNLKRLTIASNRTSVVDSSCQNEVQ